MVNLGFSLINYKSKVPAIGHTSSRTPAGSWCRRSFPFDWVLKHFCHFHHLFNMTHWTDCYNTTQFGTEIVKLQGDFPELLQILIFLRDSPELIFLIRKLLENWLVFLLSIRTIAACEAANLVGLLLEYMCFYYYCFIAAHRRRKMCIHILRASTPPLPYFLNS